MKNRKRRLRKLARELKKSDWFRAVKKHKGPLLNTAHPTDFPKVLSMGITEHMHIAYFDLPTESIDA